jgi:hypothetical protein
MAKTCFCSMSSPVNISYQETERSMGRNEVHIITYDKLRFTCVLRRSVMRYVVTMYHVSEAQNS